MRNRGKESVVSREGGQALQKHWLRVRSQQRRWRRQGDVRRRGCMEDRWPRGGPAKMLRRK